MSERNKIIEQARSVLESEVRINLHRFPIVLRVSDGALVLGGEVEKVTAKKCALSLLRRKGIPGVANIVDHLTVWPTEHRGDGALRDALCQALLEDSTFRICTVQARARGAHIPEGEGGKYETWQTADREPGGLIKITVEEGIVILEGNVPSPSHKYLAEATAWWLRGCRDVKNGLEVVPPRNEEAGELSEALRLILEKDRLIEADQIRISVQDKTITLEGLVATEEEREMAENDAWCLSAIEEVINRIEVEKTEV